MASTPTTVPTPERTAVCVCTMFPVLVFHIAVEQGRVVHCKLPQLTCCMRLCGPAGPFPEEPTGDFWLSSLHCKVEPQDGMLVMLVMSLVEHGTALCDLPANSGAEQIGSAIFSNMTTAVAAVRNTMGVQARVTAAQRPTKGEQAALDRQAASSKAAAASSQAAAARPATRGKRRRTRH